MLYQYLISDHILMCLLYRNLFYKFLYSSSEPKYISFLFHFTKVKIEAKKNQTAFSDYKTGMWLYQDSSKGLINSEITSLWLSQPVLKTCQGISVTILGFLILLFHWSYIKEVVLLNMFFLYTNMMRLIEVQ